MGIPTRDLAGGARLKRTTRFLGDRRLETVGRLRARTFERGRGRLRSGGLGLGFWGRGRLGFWGGSWPPLESSK